jgi:hypothetical protein
MSEPTAEEYRAFVRENLERHTAALTAQLRDILALRFHPDVVLLDFEVFHDGLAEELPVRGFFMDRSNNEVFSDDPALTGSSLDLLPDIPHIIPESEKPRLQAIEAAEADIDTISIEAAEIIAWFAHCWTAAGGQDFPLPAYICRHDDITSFDLKQQKWLPDEEGKFLHLED